MWVIQELLVAREVKFVCGHKTVPFILFDAFSILLSVWIGEDTRKVIDKGPDALESSHFQAFKTLVGEWSNFSAAGMINARRHYQANTGDHESLIQLLIKTSVVSSSSYTFKATNDRDRVFALLGIAADRDKLCISPDYEKLCDAVYTDTARALISHGHMDTLALCQNSNFEADLPSWVPDWRRLIRTPCGGYTINGYFAAGGGSFRSTTLVAHEYDPKILTLKGARVDKLLEVGTPWRPQVGDKIDLKAPQHLLSEVESFCKRSDDLREESGESMDIYKIPQQRKEAVWRTLSCDQQRGPGIGLRRATDVAHEGYKLMKEMMALQLHLEMVQSGEVAFDSDDFKSRMQRIKAVWRTLICDQERAPYTGLRRRATDMAHEGQEVMKEMMALKHKADTLDVDDFNDFMSRMQRMQDRALNLHSYVGILSDLHNRRPFISDQGYVGMAPAHAAPGDIICVIFGAILPFVIREDGLKNSRYRLIGEAYVHGICDGEFIEKNPDVEEMFELY